uniref:Uncharacterized protein MANES_01G262700 n=1 Tax=Rhizophora mucronata TaxID=61149 RepID=A0A2P2QDW4_RHIMU
MEASFLFICGNISITMFRCIQYFILPLARSDAFSSSSCLWHGSPFNIVCLQQDL